MARTNGLTIKIENDDEVVKWFNEIKTKATKETKDHVNKTALNVQRKAVKNAPVDDGDLRASIVIEPFLSGFSVDVGSRLFYAPYVEYGTGIHAEHPTISGRKTPWVFKHPKTGDWIYTRGFAAQPFLLPAYKSEESNFVTGIERILKSL